MKKVSFMCLLFKTGSKSKMVISDNSFRLIRNRCRSIWIGTTNIIQEFYNRK
jgi:hypothetical protein